ncbi:MAG TPA: hypothetical protein VNK43_03235 [Gemmatimonadales bacterium]|nr:hypothetical protein [Gemmatimonadales bacterium]
MGSAVAAREHWDQTDLARIVRASATLGLIETALVAVFAVVSKFLEGPIELALEAAIVAAGLAAVTVLPGRWTNARTIEGIAGAAGIGLGAATVFLLLDVALLQPLGAYGNRWWQIGGGSNWWYHPVWWMVGTFLPWMGAQVFASQVRRGGTVSVGRLLVLAAILTVLCGVAGVVIGVPYAGWTLGTFAVAYLPGLALTALITALGGRRA